MAGDDAHEAAGPDAADGCSLANASSETIGSTRIVSSATLLARQGALAIRHRDSIYYLRETRFGKLILTK